MDQWITDLMSTYGYLGIFVLIVLENFVLLIPSVFILTFGGLMTTSTDMTIVGVILTASAGSLVGAIGQYGIGRLLPLARLDAIILRYKKLLRLKPDSVRKAYAWFEKYGIWAVLLGRLIPLVRSLISFPAGSAPVKMVPFLLFTLLGSLIWNSVLVVAGANVLTSLDNVSSWDQSYWNAAWLAFVVVVLLIISAYKLIRRRGQSKQKRIIDHTK